MRETRTLEFKETITNTFLKTVSAFSNYDGGIIIFGIDDKGNVTETHSDAFWYGWENSSEKGSNADIYFNVEINGTVYNIVVESDECPEGSDVYSAAEALNIGDTVDVTGYLYWYNGPNVHVHGITVK